MNSFIPEEKENPVVTLKAQAEKFGFSKLRADESNKSANSGEQMYKDFQRMDFIVNDKSISGDLIANLYKEYDSLLPKSEDENKSYRPFAKEVFKGMFKYAEAQVPSDSILEELITSCNQLGYEGNLSFYVDTPALGSHDLLTGVLKKTININCTESSCTKIESKISTFVFDPNKTIGYKSAEDAAIATIQSSIEFTIESQNDKDDVTYKDGKLSLTVPKRLKDYNIGDKNLFDVIKECFQKLCEKFGFFKIKIGHDLDKQLKVNSVESLTHDKGRT